MTASHAPDWCVLANASRARAFVRRADAPGYDEVRSWDSPAARAHSAELGEDRPGRVFAAAGATQRSGIEEEDPEATPKGHARHAFLAEVAADLAAAWQGRLFSRLHLLAPAPVLERLRHALPPSMRSALGAVAPGDFTQRPLADIHAQCDRLRHLPAAAPHRP
jgi:hypothetical protein